MDFNIKHAELNKNTNNKEYLESQLKDLDSDFNSLYERMNKKRKELNDLEQETKKEIKKQEK
jgi:peptidoglycan hydrolase CwlO-like protein